MIGDEPIPISALEHYMYCGRQAALILVDGAWADNEHTVRGSFGHRRADTPGVRVERGRKVHRAVPLWSERLGLTGRADVVEQLADGSLVPVEYKAGVRHGDSADVQLCAEALRLEEMTGPVAKLCEAYGVRVQKSVFECRISSAAHQRLINELADAIDQDRDTVLIYRFPGELSSARLTLGRRSAIQSGGPWLA